VCNKFCSEDIKYRKAIKTPNLQNGHKVTRLQLAKSVMHWREEWQKIIFSDEKKFNFDGPGGFSFHCYDLTKPSTRRMSRYFGGGSIMLWGAFSFSKMNSKAYTAVLGEMLMPYLEKNNLLSFTF